MSSSFGQKVKISIFGQSHSEKIGVVLDGLPAGFAPDFERVSAFCARRTAIGKEGTTPRKEADTPQIVSGLVDGRTCGAPLCVLIDNTDTRSADYDRLRQTPRPSHADYCAEVKYRGFQDARGGGHFSGRLTAPLVFAGALAVQLLEQKGIRIGARIRSVGESRDLSLDPASVTPDTLETLRKKDFPCLGDALALRREIEEAEKDGDSVGGTVECFVLGLPVGLGEPMFDSLESRISALMFSVPAVKGVEFGDGFALSAMRGSQANDAFYFDEEHRVRTRTNRNGGILGGLSTGMPLTFTAAFKPTPSIRCEQETVDLKNGTDTTLTVGGRHDPCIVRRAVVVVESVAALALLEFIL